VKKKIVGPRPTGKR